MEVIKFKGSPEEFKSVAYIFNDITSPDAATPKETNPVVEEAIDPKEAIRAMLNRRQVSQEQKAVYRALADGKISYEDFRKRTGKTPEELAGVLGALGRRINQTKEIHKAGLVGNVKAIIKYSIAASELYMELTPDALEVLKENGVI